jgi:chemosensory pili system protein ChpA (sensor histidine kinase/response regulator)
MSALREAMSHAVLGWVKPELDETLRLVRQEIEAFVETPSDTSRMRFCAGYLHQVQGTLRMVELYAPAMVAEELEMLSRALQDGSVGDRDEACSTLMRGAVLLPDYLERLQEGHRDIPIVLLPLLNEIRASRGASLINESMLFPPGTQPDAATPSEAEIDHARSSLSGRNRELLDTVGNAVKEELLRVKDALDLHLRTGNDANELEPQVAELGNVADTLGMMGLGMARDVVMQQRDTLREVVAGQRPADEGTLLDVAGALLYVDASLDDQVARLGTAGDSAPDPSTAESQRTLEVLAQEAIINFAGARERFVAFIETSWDHSELADVPRLLDEVSGALRMLELGQAADYVTGVRRYVSAELIGKKRVPGGAQLDTLADAMASLEYYLEALRERRPNREDILEITRGSLESLRYWPLPVEAEPEPVVAAAPVTAAPVVAAPVVVETVEASAVDTTPAETAAGSGAFGTLSLEPLEATPAVPSSGNPFDPVSFEEEASPDAAPVSDFTADTSFEVIDAPVVFEDATPATPVVEEETADVTPLAGPVAPAFAEATAPAEMSDLRQEVAAAAAAIPASTLGGFDGDASDIDDEIREVFLEEFDEEIVNLRQLLPTWRANPDDLERLRPIRRVFHTLKGSGRLVGAKTLGEFSWKIENMLNRVLDRTRAPDHAVEVFLEQACEALPQLNAALRGQGGVTADLAGLQDVADRLAAGEDAYYSAQPTVLEDDFVEPEAAAVVAPVVEDVPAVFEPEIEGTPASVDAVLREILETEVDNHLDTVDTWLLKAQVNAVPVTEELLRAMHTMNGALAMADVPEITDVTGAAEQYIKRLLAIGETPTPEGVSALADAAQAIRRSVSALQAPSPRIPVFAALAGQLGALRDSLPEPRSSAQIVDDTHQGTYTEQMPSIDPPLAPVGIELAAMDLSAYLDTAAANGAGEAPPPQWDAPEQTVAGTEAPAAADPAPVEPAAPAQAGVTFYDIDYRITPRSRAFDAEAADAVPPSIQDVNAASAAPVATDDGVGEASSLDDAAVIEEITLESTDTVEATIDDGTVQAEATAVEEIVVATDATDDVLSLEEEATAVDVDTAAGETLAVDDEVSEPATLEAVASEDAIDTPTDSVVPAPDADAIAPATVPADETADETAVAGDIVDAIEEIELSTAESTGDVLELTESDDADVVEEASVEDAIVDEAVVVEGVEDTVASEENTAGVAAAAEDGVAVEDAIAQDIAVVPADSADEAAPEVVASAEAEEPAVTSAPPADMPEPEDALDVTGLDLELVEIFIEEGNDLLDHSDDLLAKLRDTPEDRTLVTSLQRDLHTLKGGARMAGIHAVGDLGHAIESMLESIAGQRTEMDRPAIQLLERGFDALHGQLARVTARRAVKVPDGMIAEFNARARGIELPAAPAAASEPVAPVELAPLSAPIETEFTAPVEEEFFPQGQQEQVRVRADLLDRLVNHAGEVAIYRARLEQQLGAFRGAMSELDRTNIRLHDQLRRLDLETEAQIVARYQREHEKQDPTFDPLELDRFSTLQQLSRALAESAADISGLQGVLDDLARQYDSLLQQQSRVSSELQDGLMRARMVPFEGIVPRLRRVLRQAATDTHKQVNLQLSGTHGEMDRNVLERMTAPLEHLLRNSVAHGLETPKERRKAGKPEEGKVQVTLRREGSEMVLEVTDDGAGLNREAIRRRAEQRGLIQPGAALADADLDRLILESGFSTYDQVSQLAGRGVGMDVVYNEVRQLGGTLDIRSTPGKGATFTLRLPQTLAVTQAVFVQIGEAQFAVPVAAVSGIGRISHARFEAGTGVYHYAGEDYPLYNLGHLVGHTPAKAEGQAQVPLLLVRAGELRAAVAVDQVLGNREIVVKPVGPQIASIPGIYGATITGDGSVVVILDAAPLVRRHLAQPQEATQQVTTTEQRRVPLVMVVDDSLTMRKVTSRVLERHNFEVSAARDGVEALERLEERVPDLMLLDIEMPRMDGYELATAMKADPRFKDVPIVMITSRTGDKHRQRAFDIGVQRYLGKPYQELDLMRNVYDLLGIARVRE